MSSPSGSTWSWLFPVLASCGWACSRHAAPVETLAQAPPATSAFPAAGPPLAKQEALPKAAELRRNGACAESASAASESAPKFQRIFEGAVSSLALGKASRAAIVTRPNAKVFDGTTWRTIEPELAATLHVEIFFGRDNEPRLLGYSVPSPKPAPHYRRHLRGRWHPAPEELGRLGTARAPFYGVLGHDDPEIVCAVSELCIVKRLSGWSTAPAHSEIASLRLLDGVIWALQQRSVQHLQAGLWVGLEPQRDWDRPSGIWTDSKGSAFVIEAEKNTVYRLLAGRWDPGGSPIRGPRALWGSSAYDVWLVGDGGAAHFDGSNWSCRLDLPGPFNSILASAEELWISGAAGVFQGRRRPLSSQ